jgi:hypothetical protein
MADYSGDGEVVEKGGEFHGAFVESKQLVAAAAKGNDLEASG